MARSARQQRRQRRQQSADSVAQRTPRTRTAPDAAASQPQPDRHEAPQRFRFVRESWGELKKVDWPGRNQVTQGTVVVLIACAIVGAYLWVLDLGIKQMVENVILRGT